jgi:hypothetical protein
VHPDDPKDVLPLQPLVHEPVRLVARSPLYRQLAGWALHHLWLALAHQRNFYAHRRPRPLKVLPDWSLMSRAVVGCAAVCEAVIRLTRPSGDPKSAWVTDTGHGRDLPAGLLADFARVLQRRDQAGADVLSAQELRDIFDIEYMIREPLTVLLLRSATGSRCLSLARAGLLLRRQELIRCPDIDPAVLCAERLRPLGIQITIIDKYSRRLVPGRQTAVYVQCMAGPPVCRGGPGGRFPPVCRGGPGGRFPPVWGVGVARDALGASLRAVLSAAGRSRRTR